MFRVRCLETSQIASSSETHYEQKCGYVTEAAILALHRSPISFQVNAEVELSD